MKPPGIEIQRWVDNLFEGKATYREKFIALVRFENVEMFSSTHLCATAIPLLDITAQVPLRSLWAKRGVQMPTEPWSFEGGDNASHNGNRLGDPYGGWTIWVGPVWFELSNHLLAPDRKSGR